MRMVPFLARRARAQTAERNGCVTYEQANALFKREHERFHREHRWPLEAWACLEMNCGLLWSGILHAHQGLGRD